MADNEGVNYDEVLSKLNPGPKTTTTGVDGDGLVRINPANINFVTGDGSLDDEDYEEDNYDDDVVDEAAIAEALRESMQPIGNVVFAGDTYSDRVWKYGRMVIETLVMSFIIVMVFVLMVWFIVETVEKLMFGV